MVNDQEALGSSSPRLNAEVPPGNEQERLGLYKDILYREATSLLATYLPEALPQEPAEIFIDWGGHYIGKFKGKHFITTTRSHDQTEKRIREHEEARREGVDLWEQFNKELQELIEGKIVSLKPVPEAEKEDWEEPERLLQGREQYSVGTWNAIDTLIHELIHQRQAELNPQIPPELSSPVLNKIDPKNISKEEFLSLLQGAHHAYAETVDRGSLYIPVIEGMAVLGTYYVMTRFLNDLSRKGERVTAEKIRKVRSEGIRLVIKPEIPLDKVYYEGLKMVRKLYKQFNRETPQFLAAVDLKACLQITKGSPEYQQIMENPALLPGLFHRE